jgi:hypothetical protein
MCCYSLIAKIYWFCFFVFVFLVGLVFELRALRFIVGNHKAGTPPLEPCLQCAVVWLFWRWALSDYLPRLASNCDPF